MPDAEDEPALIARAVTGDQGAFGILVRRHGPRLARSVRALGVAPADVEDVVQDAFVAAWRALAGFRPGASFAAWISVVAANKARDWSRKRRVTASRAIPLDGALTETLADPVQGAGPADARVELQRLAAALDRLPPAQRVPLVLTTVGGLSHPEAAQALGISRKAVEMRIARAREALVRPAR